MWDFNISDPKWSSLLEKCSTLKEKELAHWDIEDYKMFLKAVLLADPKNDRLIDDVQEIILNLECALQMPAARDNPAVINACQEPLPSTGALSLPPSESKDSRGAPNPAINTGPAKKLGEDNHSVTSPIDGNIAKTSKITSASTPSAGTFRKDTSNASHISSTLTAVGSHPPPRPRKTPIDRSPVEPIDLLWALR